MLGQLPPYALATPTFRFRALTALSGRASLGGDRETLVVCLQIGRLCAGLLPPYEMARELVVERAENTKQWLSSLAVPSGIRSTAFGVLGAINGFDRERCAIAFLDLVKAASAQLDEASRVELDTLLRELSGAPVAGPVRQSTTPFPTS